MHTAEALEAAVDRALEPLGMRSRELAALLVVEDIGPLGQTALRERIGVDRSTMVEILDRFAAEGVLERSPHPYDRRKHHVDFGPAGGRLTERAAAAAREAHELFLRPLDAGQRHELAELLSALAPPSDPRFLSVVLT